MPVCIRCPNIVEDGVEYCQACVDEFNELFDYIREEFSFDNGKMNPDGTVTTFK